MDGAKTATRRRNTEQLIRQVLSECAQADASMAKVALNHGLSADLVQKWCRLAQRAALPAQAFVAVTAAPATAPHDPIHLVLQRGARIGVSNAPARPDD
jgi:transposase